MGRAVTPELELLDLSLMKEANLNSLRTSHYPPLPALIDCADEMGIYVEDEGPFCWTQVADDLRLTPHIMQLNAELLARDRNHPSVFMWSICNESAFRLWIPAERRVDQGRRSHAPARRKLSECDGYRYPS